ncbi:terminase gpA endonuclease subunit, partial [Rhodoplanes sp. SY1]|uniref:terminase gpA endonuclease subunit n=1 Tax=Rhodoplanes sp. SY1 TaxID=3166646 RepID=UPI0038B53ED2
TDHAILMQRREDYRRGQVPPGALLLTIGCDVQMRGIYYEVLAHAPDRQTWVVDADYLDGSTTDVDEGAWLALTEVFTKDWPDAWGNRWRPDEFLVDSGYRTHTVYEWTRRHPGTKAVKGEDGWNRPPLGTATDVDVDYRGRKIKGGVKVRVVGTYDLKAKHYTYLTREAKFEGGVAQYPSGFCHFGTFLDENYFKQLTSEYLADERYRGRLRKVWKERSGVGNHFLDCRVYNLAAAAAYMASYTADDWARQAKARGIPEDLRTPDLFTPVAFTDAAPVPPAS